MPMTNEGSVNGSGHVQKGGEMDLVATHQRFLVAAALRTTGPMLELGVGWYSTPLLHEIARVQQRRLLTVDNNEHWLGQFRSLQCDFHSLELIGWWGDLEKWSVCRCTERVGLVFVDNGQPAEREWLTRMLMNKVDVFVFHDTEEGPAYGYNRILPEFKYLVTDKCQQSWTTIASNRVNVESWNLVPLPVVKPSQEIT